MWDGEYILFTQIRKNRIMRYDPKTDAIDVWRTGTNRTNGLCYDANGRLFGCCSGGRAIVRFDPDGKNVVVADRVDGKKLNTPNDLAVDRKGRIWFTNPDQRRQLGQDRGRGARPPLGAARRSAAGRQYTVTRVTFDTTQPNGILISGPENAVCCRERLRDRGIPRQLRAYPIKEDGSLGPYDALFTWGEDARGVHRGIDGMCLDAEGNIIATAGYYT